MVNEDMQLQAGEIEFFDSYTPSLEADTYTLTVSSGIGGISTDSYFTTPLSQSFEVRAPQFSLSTEDIQGVFPPRNGSGIYGEYVPHIVLNKRVLPWERRIRPTQHNPVPWLALLVFREGEIKVDPTTNSSLVTCTVENLLAAKADTLGPGIDPATISADVLQSVCTTITISTDVFTALTPTLADLPYLAHVRQVNPEGQVVEDNSDLGWYSILLGNRLLLASLDTGTRYYVHLVSLEGFADYLDQPPKQISQKFVQLVSLYNWTFLSQPQVGESFAQLTTNFVKEASGIPDTLLLRRNVSVPPNPDPPTQKVLDRLKCGYVALEYQAPSGESTFAWYRGPLTPVIAQPIPRQDSTYHYPSASAAMIYDSTSGIFDQSYAAAWSLGRALALADGNFGQALMRWRRRSFQLLDALLDSLTAVSAATTSDLQQILASQTVRQQFDKVLGSDIASTLSSLFRNRSEPPAQPRVARVAQTDSADPIALTQQFFESPEVQQLLAVEMQEDIAVVASWLARLQLLYNVPFEHLVPDQMMLPVESLRFFYVDQNWLDILVDGALSIGVHCSKDTFFNQALRGVVDDAVTAEVKQVRASVLGTATGDVEADSTKEAMSGILIRSSLIPGWPGLEVRAYVDSTELKLLRMDRLSSTVLLCIFLDVPNTVVLSEPHQGLRFGVEDGEVITVRQLTGDAVGKPLAGELFPTSGDFSQFYRAPNESVGGGVLNISSGATNIVQSLTAEYFSGQTLGAADFAIQMVKAPESLSFNPLSSKV